MDAYPPEYTEHNLPLIVLSGLGATHEEEELNPSHSLLNEGGFPINGHLPLVTGERAEHLLNDFLQADGTDSPWNARAARGNNGLMGFRVKSIGRVRLLDTNGRNYRALTTGIGFQIAS
jgi:trafficking protein particle complex subunit 11